MCRCRKLDRDKARQVLQGFCASGPLGREHVLSIGPMLQGLRKPVNDLSRGASVDDITYTIALTAIQASQTEAAPAP